MATLVQTSTEIAVTAGTSGNVTVSGVAAGNLLVCVSGNESNATGKFSVSDDKGNTWGEDVHNYENSATGGSAIHSARNTASGNTVVTVTCSGASTYKASVLEVSVLDTTNTTGATSTNNETSTGTAHNTSLSSGLMNQRGAAFWVTIGMCSADPGTRTPGTGWTAITTASTFSYKQYRITSGDLTGNRGDWTSTNARQYSGCMAAYQSVAAASGPVGQSCW